MATKKSAAKSPAKTAAKTPAKASTKAAEKMPAKARPPAAAPKSSPTHQEISELAHKYFVERGHRHGSHHDDWLRAEKELNS